jgi:predicted HD superfamily hydrolase involved in NAD metabolism
MKSEDLLHLAKSGNILSVLENRPIQVWHGPCAAVYISKNLKINDDEILSAIACHTTGKKNMSLLDKIVFLADYISSERDFSEVSELRKLCKTSIDKAMIFALNISLKHIENTKKPLDKDTLAALEFFKSEEVI